MIEVEQSQDRVEVVCADEVGRLNRYIHPLGRRALIVPRNVFRLCDLHVNTIRYRVEVEHDGLLFESEGLMSLPNNRVYILVNGLLEVQILRVYFLDVFSDVRQSD